MEAASLVMEITVISAEALRVNSRKPVKKNAYVVVRTDSKNSEMTRVDTEGGSFSTWNQKLVMNLPAQARFVTVEVHCKGSSGDRVIGTARVPVSDFSGGLTPESYLHFLSYRLRDEKGERNGIVNLSVRMKGSVMAAPPQRMWPETVVGGGWDCSGVVVGVPVHSSYRTVQV